MSEAVKAKKPQAAKGSGRDMVRLTVTLLAIAAVCALLLGLVNMVTKDPIAAAKKAKTEAAMAQVLAAERYEEIPYLDEGGMVLAVYQAGDAGYVVEVGPSGFGGVIDMMVGVDHEGTCTGISIISMSETAGLGANAKKDWFRERFVGQSGTVQVTKDGGAIDALTGATITSRAVAAGVTAALEAVATLG